MTSSYEWGMMNTLCNLDVDFNDAGKEEVTMSIGVMGAATVQWTNDHDGSGATAVTLVSFATESEETGDQNFNNAYPLSGDQVALLIPMMKKDAEAQENCSMEPGLMINAALQPSVINFFEGYRKDIQENCGADGVALFEQYGLLADNK